jgi:DNA uptake protein ComE-like DNA-binding protein
MNIRLLGLLTLLLVLFPGMGCTLDDDDLFDSRTYTSELSAADEALILDFVNYPGTDYDVLDKVVRLDRRAAENIVTYRNGADGVAPSSDDQLFVDVEELLSIKWVGPVSVDKIRAHAEENPPPAGEVVEGVSLRGWQAEVVVYTVNKASVGVLKGIGLNTTQATNLVENAPYESVTQMGSVPQIGPVAIERLRYASRAWWHAMMQYGDTDAGGVYAGVSFDGPTAELALEIANFATREQLVEDGQVWSTGASRIIDNRPYDDLQEVADTWGIGTATLQSLHDYAISGLWSVDAAGQ